MSANPSQSAQTQIEALLANNAYRLKRFLGRAGVGEVLVVRNTALPGGVHHIVDQKHQLRVAGRLYRRE